MTYGEGSGLRLLPVAGSINSAISDVVQMAIFSPSIVGLTFIVISA
jgi:hypothetical protein